VAITCKFQTVQNGRTFLDLLMQFCEILRNPGLKWGTLRVVQLERTKK
jgi:hypothetical protein